jgi:hypothetical protein
MKAIISIIFTLSFMVQIKSQSFEINTFALSISNPKTSVSNVSEVLNKGSISSQRLGKGINFNLGINKNAFIGLNYQTERVSIDLKDYKFDISNSINNANTDIGLLRLQFKSQYFGVNYHYHIPFYSDSVSKIRISLVPQFDFGFNITDQFQTSVYYQNSYFNQSGGLINFESKEKTIGGLPSITDARWRAQTGLGIQASSNHISIFGGYRYGLNQWYSNTSSSGLGYLPPELSSIQINLSNSYLYLGIGYIIAPFSKEKVF